jgi:hypothetical protein
MRSSRSRLVLLIWLCCIAFASGQTKSSETQAPKVGNDFVQREFGKNCTINPAVPPVTADLNDDKIEDIVIPARCRNPMMDAGEHNYTVLDPSNAFYGFGDPRITTQYSGEDPEIRDLALLIIHGVRPDGWESPGAKVKFLLVNVPYKTVAVQRFRIKKKRIMAIYVEEATDDKITSAIFWDGKKYKYEPIGSSLD